MNNKWIEQRKRENIFVFLLLSLSFFATFYIAGNTIDYTYNLLWILPAVYFVSTLIFFKILRKSNYKYGVVFITANIVIFFRFVVTSFSIVYFSNYSGLGYGPDPGVTSMNTAIILMALELILVYITLSLATFYFSKKQSAIKYSSKYPREKDSKIFNNKVTILIFIIIFTPIILINAPESLIPDLSFLSENTNNIVAEIDTAEIASSGLTFLATPVLRLCILFLYLSMVKKLYNKSNNNIYIILGWIGVFYYLSLVISSSRWIVVFSAVICMFLMKHLFPKTPKMYFYILIAFLIIIFLGISINKFSWSVRNSSTPYIDIIQVLSQQFQEYFSGPRVVAQSLDMAEVYGNSMDITTLINDFIGSIPGLAGIVDQTNRTNIYFNYYLNVGNTSHIIPMLGNGYAYLPFFPSFLMVFAQWFMMWFDYLYKKENNWELKYLYGYMGLYLSMSMGFNVQIIFGNFISYFLMPYMLFTINKKIILKPNREESIMIGEN